jgi:hypothetical protein
MRRRRAGTLPDSSPLRGQATYGDAGSQNGFPWLAGMEQASWVRASRSIGGREAASTAGPPHVSQLPDDRGLLQAVAEHPAGDTGSFLGP